MTAERRQLPRYPCQLRASIMIDGQLFEAMCTDIGPGGAYLATSVMPAPGTRVSVALASPAATSMIAVPAEVMYTVHRSATRRTGCAVRWVESPPSLNRAIASIELSLSRSPQPSHASQAITSPQPAAGAPVESPSSAAVDKTAKYRASPVLRPELPITQRTGKKG